MMFGSFFFLLLIGFGIWWFMQQQNQGRNPLQPRGQDPMEIARNRYARGEISREQYDEIRNTLSGA